jgi:hypothetical protein
VRHKRPLSTTTPPDPREHRPKEATLTPTATALAKNDEEIAAAAQHRRELAASYRDLARQYLEGEPVDPSHRDAVLDAAGKTPEDLRALVVELSQRDDRLAARQQALEAKEAAEKVFAEIQESRARFAKIKKEHEREARERYNRYKMLCLAAQRQGEHESWLAEHFGDAEALMRERQIATYRWARARTSMGCSRRQRVLPQAAIDARGVAMSFAEWQ